MSPVDLNPQPDSVATSVSLADRVGHWLGLIRFSHTIFALPFALLATAMAFAAPAAGGLTPEVRIGDLVGILLCMVFARSAAMAFNRLVDHKIDAANPRTSSRHIPAGVLGRGEVLVFTIGCSIAFVASTLLFLPNRLPLLAAVPVLLFLCGYSLAKRFTASAHVWLGVALSLSPICAWVAIRGDFVIANPSDLAGPLILAAAVAAWVAGFDMIYACQDADYDSEVGLNSVPAKFGVAGALRIAKACHLVMLLLLAALPVAAADSGLGWLFWAAIVVVAGLVLRQHALVRPDDLDRVNQAFFDTNAAISLTLLAVGVIDCFVV